MSRVFDNGSGATLQQAANQTALGAVLSTVKPVKASAGITWGFSTSTALRNLRTKVDALEAAIRAAGIGKT